MNPSELFERWAPDQGAWSSWVKPVLFACGTADEAAHTEWRAARERVRGRYVPPRSGDTVLIFDLAGPEALATALECAAHGYRPVPLFNSSLGVGAVVANGPIRAGLELGLDELAAAPLTADAMPAFVLDARRMKGDAKPLSFDNRWLVFPQDFPSANALSARGIRRVILVQDSGTSPQSDLAHVLLRWQRAGLAILALDLASGANEPVEIRVSTPTWFRALFYRLLATTRLRRNSAGGFGAIVPQVAAGGTGFS